MVSQDLESYLGKVDITGVCTRNEPVTLETGQPEKPTPSGFRA